MLRQEQWKASSTRARAREVPAAAVHSATSSYLPCISSVPSQDKVRHSGRARASRCSSQGLTSSPLPANPGSITCIIAIPIAYRPPLHSLSHLPPTNHSPPPLSQES